jgi:[amino group carrier protein]-L-2-aminoadipate 6-kinase
MTELNDVLLVKVGGGSAINLEGIAADLAAVPGPVVVVHGANALRDRLAAQLGLHKRVITSVSGYDSVYSDDEAIDLLMLAYAGLANKRIVEHLQRHGRNAIGLTGLDGRLVSATRNKGIRVREAGKTLLVRDRSGKPASVNGALLDWLLGAGYTPVITVPLIDETGAAVNAENDDVVVALQGVIRARRIVHLIEAPGLLADPADPTSVLPRLPARELEQREAEATGRFKRKLHALGRLFGQGSPVVTLADGRVAHPVANALAGKGTIIA